MCKACGALHSKLPIWAVVHGLAFLAAGHRCREGSGMEKFQLLDSVLVSRSAFVIVRCHFFIFTFKIDFFVL